MYTRHTMRRKKKPNAGFYVARRRDAVISDNSEVAVFIFADGSEVY